MEEDNRGLFSCENNDEERAMLRKKSGDDNVCCAPEHWATCSPKLGDLFWNSFGWSATGQSINVCRRTFHRCSRHPPLKTVSRKNIIAFASLRKEFPARSRTVPPATITSAATTLYDDPLRRPSHFLAVRDDHLARALVQPSGSGAIVICSRMEFAVHPCPPPWFILVLRRGRPPERQKHIQQPAQPTPRPILVLAGIFHPLFCPLC